MQQKHNRVSAGERFRAAVAEEKPLQVAGAINAYTARMAEATGFRALYLSGGGVAANSLGIPDLGISTMEDVLTDVRRITDATALPLLVDIDTGWGGAFNIARTIRSMIKAGAAAVHIEDQVGAKRCGHRPGKELVAAEEMVDRIKAAVDARTDEQFRDHGADGCAGQRRAGCGDRARAGLCGGGRGHDFCRGGDGAGDVRGVSQGGGRADPCEHYGVRADAAVDARGTGGAGVDIILYCCAAYRAMNAAALKVYEAIRTEGTQKHVMPMMQTRADSIISRLSRVRGEAG